MGSPLTLSNPGAPGSILLGETISGDFKVSENELVLDDIKGLVIELPGPFDPDIDTIRITPGRVEVTF